jgi:tetratricopeptide (TPR) repeat protein
MKYLSFLIAALILSLLVPGPGSAQDVQTYIQQGMEKCQKGQYDQCIKDFDQALKLKPNDPAILTYRGVAYYAKGQNDQALQDFDQALKINPNFAEAYYQRAKVYDNLQKYDKAVADLKRAKNLGYNVGPGFLRLLEEKATTARGWKK